MSFNDRNILAGIVGHSHKTGDAGIKSRGLGQLGSDGIRGELSAWIDPCTYDYVQGAPKPPKPDEWTAVDTFLSIKLGLKVKYEPIDKFRPTKCGKEKVVSRYSSALANQQLKINKSDFTEADLLKGINKVGANCDLKQATVEALPDLKEVMGDLSLDVSSALKDLSNLEKIGGKLKVFAKNQEEMQNYLKQLGLMSKDGTLLSAAKDQLVFVMKTYL